MVNGADCDGFYMDQVGAFSTIDCRNPEHGHPFGGGSWWQEGFRKLLKDQRANCRKPVFFATEGNAEHSFDQIDAFVCWNIPGGVDTVPAFEVCYSGAVTVYCRSYGNPATQSREMRMKLANTLADGELTGWLPVSYCRAKEIKDYLRECVRFRQRHAAWFYKGEMRRPPRLRDKVPEWSETWDIFGSKRPSTMPIVQTGARRLLDYDCGAFVDLPRGLRLDLPADANLPLHDKRLGASPRIGQSLLDKKKIESLLHFFSPRNVILRISLLGKLCVMPRDTSTVTDSGVFEMSTPV